MALWCLENSGDGIFLLVNGRRANDGSVCRELPSICNAWYGNNKTEIWLTFSGKNTGRRMNRLQFHASNEFSKAFEGCNSNTLFLKQIWEHGVGKKPAGGKCKKPDVGVRKKPAVEGSSTKKPTEQPQPPIELETQSQQMKEKFVGQFNVQLMQLRNPPQEMLCREVNGQWVEMIKGRIMKNPSPVASVLPVLLDNDEIKTKEQFRSDDLLSYKFFTLGGNHLRQAAAEAIEEDKALETILGNINVHIYLNLTKEEAIQIGNSHNFKSQTLEFTLQDKIYQARKVTDGSLGAISKMLTEIETKKIPLTSLSTVAMVVKMPHEMFRLVEDMFHAYSTLHGCGKSFPIQIFKSLQGLTDESKIHFMRKAAGNIKELTEVVKEIQSLKKKRLLETLFIDITKTESLADAAQQYPEHVKRIDDFLDLTVDRKKIPECYIKFCQSALEGVAATAADEEFSVVLSVVINDKEIKNTEVLNLLKRKVVQEIKTNKKIKTVLSSEEEEQIVPSS